VENNQKETMKRQVTRIPSDIFDICGFEQSEVLALQARDGVIVLSRQKPTVKEQVRLISSLLDLAAELTTALGRTTGFCDNCGEGCAFGRAECVKNCELCRDILEGVGITLPDYLLEEAGIPKDAKLEAFTGGDGEIVVIESERQFDVTDFPPQVLTALIESGVCIAALDEQIMLEETGDE